MRKFKASISLILIAALLAALSACSPKSGAPGESQPPRVKQENDPVTIWFIPKNMGNPYFDAISGGFHDAFAELGEENFSYTYAGPDTADPDSQIPYFERAIEAKADAIFISPNSDTALCEVMTKAMSAGVRVYCINQDIEDGSYRDAAILPVDFHAVGSSLISLMGEQMEYKGDFAIVSATQEAPDQNYWIGVIKDALNANPKYANMNLLEVVYGDDQPQKSAEVMQGLIEKYPDLKGVIAPTAAGLPSVCEVVRDSGLSGKLKITGLGLPSTMAEHVNGGVCESFLLWNPPYEGYLGAYLAWAERDTDFKPAADAQFSAGKLGDYTITKDGQIMTLTSPMQYDAANVNQYAVQF